MDVILNSDNITHFSVKSSDFHDDILYILMCRINPVTGRAEDTPPNPLEGMSEEQKEYEAMQLVMQLDKLAR